MFCLVVCLLLLAALMAPGSATLHNQALAQGPCTVTNLNPHTAPDGSTTGFAFTVQDDNDSIAWIQVTSPSANLVIVNANSDWLPNVVQSSDHAYFYGDAIAPGNPIQVSVSASVSSFPPSNWTVQASTDSSGSNPMTCGGDTSVSVIDTTPPNITSISANTTTTTATIHWTTDKVTNGTVDYGTTTSYGRQASDTNFSTTHSVTLTGLTPSLVYHYQISVTDQSSNSNQSVDSTFVTATPSSNGGSGSGGGSGVTITNPKDKTPPTIQITSKLPKVFTTPPVVSGVAADNDKVVRVEYSTDGGLDWLPVDVATGLNTKSVTFSFKPLNLTDDTYIFMARAIDGGGNSTKTKGITVVIDRLPPVLGGNVIALGPQVLVPNGFGVINTLTGVSLSFHTSATGGATHIAINAIDDMPHASAAAPNFTLQQAPDSGLWSGSLSFSEPGTYTLIAHAIDGANNKTTRTVGIVHVAQAGRVISTNGPVAHATVTAYYRDPDTNDWTAWDGLPYGQTNPQSTNAHGGFQMFLPPGTYYLHATANGYQDLNSSSFTLTQPTPLTAILHLTPAFGVGPVHVPWFSFGIQPIANAQTQTGTTSATPSVVGKSLDAITLSDTTGVTQNSISWLGKPTVVTILSTWAPAASEQVGALAELAQNNNLNVEVVGMQEGAERLSAYDAIAGSDLVWLADPDSQSVGTLNPTNLPMHYFIDRKGIVRDIEYGVRTYQQLLDTLTNLP